MAQPTTFLENRSSTTARYNQPSVLGRYENVTHFLQDIQTWDDEMIGGGLSMLAHTAYHLGAIRQLGKVLEGKT